MGTGFRENLPRGLFSTTLFQDKFACAFSSKHPLAKKKSINLYDYLQASHLYVAPFGLGIEKVDEELRLMGAKRNISATMPHFSVACFTLLETDHILTLPKRVLEKMSKVIDIEVRDLPFEVEPFDVYLIWHESNHRSPQHQWLRKTMREILD